MEGKEKEDEFDRKAREVVTRAGSRLPEWGYSEPLIAAFATALRDQHERACAAVCFRCADAINIAPACWSDEQLTWVHPVTRQDLLSVGYVQFPCEASAIRRAFAVREEG